MAGERVILFGAVTVLCDASAAAALNVYTDLPGDALALRYTAAIPVTTGRRPVRVRLPGDTKGRIWYPEIIPNVAGTLRLYGMEVWARVLPGRWAWYPVPVVQTGEWQSMKLPIPPTPEEWSTVKLPIEATPDEWSAVKLPIEPTPNEWSAMKLPIESTPDEWQSVKLPLKSSPPTPDWVDIPVDE